MQGFSQSSNSITYSGGATETQSFMFPVSSQNNHFQAQALNTTSGNSCITGEFWSGENNVLPCNLPGPLSALKDQSADEESIFQVQTPNWFR